MLLSAICVQKPLLTFQKAKLKFEEALQASGDITFSIVRPTAFMKSLAGQVESCKGGGPYVMFGDGQLASCKARAPRALGVCAVCMPHAACAHALCVCAPIPSLPTKKQPISEPDLASYMADCIREPAQWDRVLPIGGPGVALSALQQGEMLFDILGQKPRFIQVPVALFDAIIAFLDFLASLFAGMKDTAEFGRIGKYYAVESMLVMNPKTGQYDADATPSYGKDTLRCVGVAWRQASERAWQACLGACDRRHRLRCRCCAC